MPRATVILPTYNWSSVLPYSIGSVLRQTMPDLELLVIGDACTDDTEEVVERINDPRVHFINRTERVGDQSGPNNEGLERAASPVVFYLGHDDLWMPHHVQLLLSKIEEGAGVVYGMTLRVGPGDEQLRLAMQPGPYYPGKWLPPTGLAHRLAVFRSVGGWDRIEVDQPMPEVRLVRRAFEAGFKVAFVCRLTAIKIPATYRVGVYDSNPSHEQEAWFNRICSEPDLEAKLLATVLSNWHESMHNVTIGRQFKRLIRRVLREVRGRSRA